MCRILAGRFTEMLRVLLSDCRDPRRAAFSLLLLPIWHLLCCSVRAGHVTDTESLHVRAALRSAGSSTGPSGTSSIL